MKTEQFLIHLRRWLPICFCIAFFSITSYAQNSTKELTERLKSATENERPKLLNDLAENLAQSNPRACISKADEALISAEKNGDELMACSALFIKAGCLEKSGERKKAISNYQQCIDKARANGYKRLQAEGLKKLAALFEEKNQFEKAFRALEQFTKLVQKAGKNRISELENANVKSELQIEQTQRKLTSEIKELKEAKQEAITAQKEIVDSISALQMMNALQLELQAMDIKEQQMKLDQQNLELQRQRELRMFSLAFVLLLLLVLGLLFKRYHDKKTAQEQLQKINEQINEKNRQLERTLEQLKDTQQQLIVREKLASLGKMTRGIAHEIQNPLNFVNNFAKLNAEIINELTEIGEKVGVSDQLKEEIAELADDILTNNIKIVEHGGKASNIVSQMISAVELDEFELEPTQIDKLIESTVQNLNPMLIDAGVEISLDLAKNVPTLQLDPQGISKVLENLLLNAYDAIISARRQDKKCGKINLKLDITDKMLNISIVDDGTGFDEKVAERLFEPFFTTKETGKGTGLGLSIAYEIITMGHNGEINGSSDPNNGATFCISLPIDQDSVESNAEEEEA